MRFIATLLISTLYACNPSGTDSTPAAGGRKDKAKTAPAAGAADALPRGASAPLDLVVASWEGGEITYGELYGEIQSQLVQMEAEYITNKYTAESGALGQFVAQKLLDQEVKERGLADIEALIKIEVEDKVVPPTEDELKAFYEVMQRQLRGMPYEMARPQVEAELIRRQQSEIFSAWMDALKEKRGVKNALPFPDVPRAEVSADDDPFLGPENAEITIIQFAEFQCPYCGKAGEAVDQVMKEYPGKVKMVYRDFPLGFHDRAIPAAIAANCAGAQDKYWEMHGLLMDNQRALDEDTLKAHASALQLDLAKWETCRQDPAQAAEVQKDMADGSAVGVTGTPAFFINGIMLSGAQPFSEFKNIIDRELEG